MTATGQNKNDFRARIEDLIVLTNVTTASNYSKIKFIFGH